MSNFSSKTFKRHPRISAKCKLFENILSSGIIRCVYYTLCRPDFAIIYATIKLDTSHKLLYAFDEKAVVFIFNATNLFYIIIIYYYITLHKVCYICIV